MRQRRFRTTLGALTASVLVLAACGEGEAETDGEEVTGDEVTLTLGHPFPATHVIHEQVLEPFVDEVLEATDGTVEIELVPGGALGPGDAVYENVVAGAQDMGFALHGYTAGRFPIAQIVELPFATLDGDAMDMTDALWDLYEEFPEFQDEYDDVKVAALWTHDPGYLWTADDRVETMDDVSGLSLRSPGPVSGDLIEALGAAAVGMPAPETYDAIERGVVDGLMIAANGVADFGLYEVLDYGVRCDCYTSPMFIVMNLEQWESLSDEQRDILDDLMGRDLSLRAAEAYDDEVEASLQTIDDAGIEIIELDQDEHDRWRDAGQGPIDEWIDAREDEGVPGQDMYERLLEVRGIE